MDDVNGGSSFVHRVRQNLHGERKSGPSKKDLQGEGSPGPKGFNPFHDIRVLLSFSIMFLPSLRKETLSESFEKQQPINVGHSVANVITISSVFKMMPRNVL